MTDQGIIDKTYEMTIQQLYMVVYDALLISTDVNQRKDAEDRFQSGVRKARGIRDRAKKLLP